MSNLKKDILPIPIQEVPTSLVNYLLKLTETVDKANDYLDYKGGNEVSASQIKGHINDKENPHQTDKTQIGLGYVENIKCNFNASNAPTIINDSSQDYSIGSRWVDTVNDKLYTCLDATAGAAVWKEIAETTETTKNNVAPYPPTINDDIIKDYVVGSVWLDTSLNQMYKCFDNTAGTAVWKVVNKIYEQGFLREIPESMGLLSFDDATRTFTIDVADGQENYYFWVNGARIIKTKSESIVIPDVSGSYYIYYDNDGVLRYVAEANADINIFYYYALVALVYWNSTAKTSIMFDERHGINMSASTHIYNHKTFGARYEPPGLNIEGLTAGGATYTRTTEGFIWDEDIQHSFKPATTHQFLYRLGDSGEWVVSDPDNKICFKNGGSYGVWNEWTGSTWKLTEGTLSTDFVIYFYVAFPNAGGGKIYKLVGQNAYSKISDAKDAIKTEIRNISTERLISPEFVFLYAIIVKRDGTLQALSDGSLYLDLRHIKGVSGSASVAKTNDVDVGDYGGNFVNYTPPVGLSGDLRIAIDTNSTSSGKRIYVYANNEWCYADLT